MLQAVQAVLIEQFNPATLVIFAAMLLLSFLAIAIFFLKLIQFLRMGVGHRREADSILDTWLAGRAEEAIRQAERRRSVLTRILHSVFSGLQARPGDPAYAEELGRQTAIIELASMSERMRLLDMVVQASPMLGLLGTVIGMIDAFSVLASTQGAVDPALLAGGIYTALTTTAVGLAIALVAFLVATLFESRIDRERNMIEAVISAAIHGRVNPSTRYG